MTQRIKHCPNNLNLESHSIACEKYISRLFQREKATLSNYLKPSSASIGTQKFNKERISKQGLLSTPQNQLSKLRTNLKQQNLPSPKHSLAPNNNVLQYADDSALVEVTVKTTNPRQRSRSTVAEREPWSLLLKQQKSSDRVSVFSNFDPLRTLHFLAKELQYQLEAVLPEDKTIIQMVYDMQTALKRVPPEVASTIHLQQAMDMIPNKKGSTPSLVDEKPEKLKPITMENGTQTPCPAERKNKQEGDGQLLEKLMVENTEKLEASCKQLELLCEDLKAEKDSLQRQLIAERDKNKSLKKKLGDMEFENENLLKPKIEQLEGEKEKMQCEITDLNAKVDGYSIASTIELKDLKSSKASIEEESNKLKHQLRLCAIEKEKYNAVLAVRDRQINEIRSEMTQLQEVVNEQLMELHNNAFASMPSNTSIGGKPSGAWDMLDDQNKENMGNAGDTLSSIQSNGDPVEFIMNRSHDNSFKDLPAGDVTSVLNELPSQTAGFARKEPKTRNERPDRPELLGAVESQVSVRSMFDELKKTAYAVAGYSRKTSNHNLASNS